MGMMINRRRVMGNKKGLLPSGYTQVEYMRSTQNLDASLTNHIDTGVVLNAATDTVKISFLFNAHGNGNVLFGSDTQSGGRMFEAGMWTNKLAFSITDTTFPNITERVGDLSVLYTLLMTPNKSYLGLWDERLNDFTTYYYRYDGVRGNFTTPRTAWIFGINRHIGTYAGNYESDYQIYRCTILRNNTPIRDYIPCINPNNTTGMYDLVNNVFYSFNGIAGNPV